MRAPRHRTNYLVLGSLLALIYMVATDPSSPLQFSLGPFAMFAALMGQLTVPILAVWFAFLARKALFDYSDMEVLYKKAKESTVGAGLVFVGMCIVFFALLGLFGTQVHAQDVKTYIPVQAKIYLPTVKSEQLRVWKDHPAPFYLQA